MTHLLFGGGRELSIRIANPSALYRGVGINRLLFHVDLDTRNSMNAGVAIDLRGEIWLSPTNEWLGLWATPDPIVSRDEPFQTTVLLPLSDQQLAVIEDRRAGSDLQLRVEVRAALGYDPQTAEPRPGDPWWPGAKVNEELHIEAGSWQRLLSQTALANSLTIVVPTSLVDAHPQAMQIGLHLRDAIRKVNAGEYADAVIAARRALDTFESTWANARQATQVSRKERTIEHRLGILHEGLFSLASAAPHGDPMASSISWDRNRAWAVIAAVAALAACAAEESS